METLNSVRFYWGYTATTFEEQEGSVVVRNGDFKFPAYVPKAHLTKLAEWLLAIANKKAN
jgi:hypothetical protein